jgi:outer membrane protein, heavy metal efflux system
MLAIRRVLILSGFAAVPILPSTQAAALDLIPEPPPYTAVQSTGDSGAPLSLDEAARLSMVDQPILTGREALIDANERQAVAASQLPDPRLSTGLKELPVDTSEAFSVRRDNFTEFTIGLSQDLPRADKRRLKSERKRLEADTERAAFDNDRRTIRREVSLAWLDVYEAEQSLALNQRLAEEAALQLQSLAKDYGNGKTSQADWLAAKVDASLAEDKAHDRLHHVQRMRAELARWIGDDSRRPLANDLSLSAQPGELVQLIESVDHHPVIAGLDKEIETSATDISLARQAYEPDVSVEGYFAYRPGFSDFVGVQVTVDLPYFTKNRQDPELAAALQRSHASADRKRDMLRDLHSQVSEVYLDWQHFRQRASEFDTRIIPDAMRRIDDARKAYAAGRGSFDAVLLSRRSLIDIQLQRLTLYVEATRAQVRLQYFASFQELLGDAP